MKIDEFDPSQTVILRPSRLKWIGVFLICAVFTVIGVLMIRDGAMKGWLPTLIFGAGLVISFLPLIGFRSSLTLGPEGFEQMLMGRRMAYRWDEVSEFGVWGMSHGPFSSTHLVSFEPLHEDDTKLKRLNRGLAGASSALGDTFGMKAIDLAIIMNLYREVAKRGK